MSFKKDIEVEFVNNQEFPWRWTSGDIAEVFESNSWKLAKVTRVHSQDYLLVKLLGSCVERSVHISTIRPCQTLPYDKRVVIEKDFGKLNKGRHILPKEGKVRCPRHAYARKKSCARKIHFPANCTPHPLGLKRRPDTYLQYIEPFTRPVKKMIGNDKKRTKHQAASEESTNICGNDYKKVVGKTHLSASFYNRSEFFYNHHCFGVSSGPSETEKSASSVGSCSFGSSPSRIFHSTENNNASNDMGCQDVSLSLEQKHSFIAKKLSRKEIHVLELHAYRTTLRALHASGPISWDQETLMTNLRCALHISNDEHLLEVRNLLSAEKGVSVR